MKPIVLSKHAKEQSIFRNASVDEIVETIETTVWESAELGRLECRKNFSYENEWNGKYYKTKQVRPIFVEEQNNIFVVTIYTYFF